MVSLLGAGWARAGDGAQRLGELAGVGVWQPAGDVFAGDGGQDRGGLVQQDAACGGDGGHGVAEMALYRAWDPAAPWGSPGRALWSSERLGIPEGLAASLP